MNFFNYSLRNSNRYENTNMPARIQVYCFIVMKTPICNFDAKTGILCNKCDSRLKLGHITEGDVQASIKMAKLAQKNQDIDKFTLVAAHNIDDEIILIMKNSDVTVIRSNEKIMDLIKKEFDNKVWFVESGASDKRFLENILFPLKISLMNMVWLPDGNKLTKIIVSNYNKIDVQVKKIQEIARKIKNIEVIIEFGDNSK